jgi:hypothetical protein
MYVLSGAYVKSKSKISLGGQDLKVVYPIELYLGGRLGFKQMNFESREI